MSSKNNRRSPRRTPAAARTRAQLLPMGRSEALNLALRTRIALERLRNGEADRPLINHLAQVAIITGFITRAGYGKLDIGEIDRVEQGLGQVIIDADHNGTWSIPDSLIDSLTAVVNDYDRALGETRMEIMARASDHLERLMNAAAYVAPSKVTRHPGTV